MIEALQLLSDNASRVNGLGLMLTDLCCKSSGFYIGAENVVRVLVKENQNLKKIIIGANPNATLTLEKNFTNPTREVDIYVEMFVNGKLKQKLREIKSVKKLSANFVEQFSKDLQHITSLDELIWIFDSKYVGKKGLHEDVIAALKSKRQLLEIPNERARAILQNEDLENATPQEISEAIIDFFRQTDNFNQVFKKL
jgi:hypothetical protein